MSINFINKPNLLTKENWSGLIENVDTILLYTDGCLWHQWEPIEGAIDAVKYLEKLQKSVILVTNNGSLSTNMAVEKCQKLGFSAFNQTNTISTAHVLAQHLKISMDIEKKVYCPVDENHGLKEELDLAGFNLVPVNIVEKTDESFVEQSTHNCSSFKTNDRQHDLDPTVSAVVISGFTMSRSWSNANLDVLVKARSYLRDRRVRFLVTSEDLPLMPAPPCESCGKNWPDSGCIVQAMRLATEREPVVVGKPSTVMFEFLMHRYQLNPARTLMIGDSMATDVKFANAHGMRSLCVLSGKTQSSEEFEELYENEKVDLLPEFYTSRLGDLIEF